MLPANSRVKASQDGRSIGIRTSNDAERVVCEALERDGWTVINRGWPDFLAIRGTEVRFIEVKPNTHSRLKPVQREVAKILLRFGIHVEMKTPDDVRNGQLDGEEAWLARLRTWNAFRPSERA